MDRMSLQQWFPGIYLIGQFNWLRTGCWLLHHGNQAALLEMPPAGLREADPASVAQAALAALPNVTVKYLLCTHAHLDHYSSRTHRRLRAAFPEAQTCVQRGFSRWLTSTSRVLHFDDELQLELSGEPLFLVHASKHSWTDTMVIFRGVVCTGDWELGTIRSVHDWKPFMSVPNAQKLDAISRMEHFPTAHHYHIHSLYSVHANDRREGVDFPQLMANTREDRPL